MTRYRCQRCAHYWLTTTKLNGFLYITRFCPLCIPAIAEASGL